MTIHHLSVDVKSKMQMANEKNIEDKRLYLSGYCNRSIENEKHNNWHCSNDRIFNWYSISANQINNCLISSGGVEYNRTYLAVSNF